MTPDPTTRDPAASLRACIELAAKATPGEWEADSTGLAVDAPSPTSAEPRRTFPVLCGYFGLDEREHNAAAIAAAVNFLRDDAPALLAEVAARESAWLSLKDQYSELARAVGCKGDAWFGDPLESHAEVVAKAEAAERALAGAVADEAVERALAAFDMPTNPPRGSRAMLRSERLEAMRAAISAALNPHHGARTGDSNG
jgi:hypothetical protein